jgi:hypothetical protein
LLAFLLWEGERAAEVAFMQVNMSICGTRGGG